MYTNQRIKNAKKSTDPASFIKVNLRNNYINMAPNLGDKLKYMKEFTRLSAPRRRTTQASTKHAYMGVEILKAIKGRKELIEKDLRMWLLFKRQLSLKMAGLEAELYKTISTVRSDMFKLGAGFWLAPDTIKTAISQSTSTDENNTNASGGNEQGEAGFLTYYKPKAKGDNIFNELRRRRGRGTNTIVSASYDADNDSTSFKVIKKDDARDVVFGSKRSKGKGSNGSGNNNNNGTDDARQREENGKKNKSGNNYETKVDWKDQRNPNSGTFYTDNMKELIKKNPVPSPEYQNIENFNTLTEIASQEIKVVLTKNILDFTQAIWSEHTRGNNTTNDKTSLKKLLEEDMSSKVSRKGGKSGQDINPTASVVPNGSVRPLLYFADDTRINVGFPAANIPGVAQDFTKMHPSAPQIVQEVIKTKDLKAANENYEEMLDNAESYPFEDFDIDMEEHTYEIKSNSHITKTKGRKHPAKKKEEKILQENEKRTQERALLNQPDQDPMARGKDPERIPP